jgi:hypothetical protein
MLAARRKRSKYSAVKTEVDGHRFDSLAEAACYLELKLLEKVGTISCLELQPVYELAPSVKYAGAKRAKPALRYFGDFRYIASDGRTVVADVKGMVTDVYAIKKHLMLAIHGIEIVEIRKK